MATRQKHLAPRGANPPPPCRAFFRERAFFRKRVSMKSKVIGLACIVALHASAGQVEEVQASAQIITRTDAAVTNAVTLPPTRGHVLRVIVDPGPSTNLAVSVADAEGQTLFTGTVAAVTSAYPKFTATDATGATIPTVYLAPSVVTPVTAVIVQPPTEAVTTNTATIKIVLEE
ncbi:MAG: hypothetical protein NTY53_18590 [Kiritimatiellaeota bacterium]|nr:hypothetical protein [Kiritimatiellota bacterium]